MTVRPIPALPDRPNEWAEVDSHYGRFMQRWRPGAFGDLESLEGVERYRVIREYVTVHPEPSPGNPLGLPERTITKAEVP